jgi:ribosome-binding protein aMBF1 (putative translation factor)
MGKRGEITGYTSYSIDEIYAKKLEDLCIKIRAVTYYGIVYAVSQQYCCKFCKCRIMVRGNERIYCLGCQEVPFWNEATRTSVAQIMQSYPTLQECQEASRPHRDPTTHITTEKVAYGSRVEEARLAIGWSREYLADQIVKKQGGTISPSTISGIERGMQSPSPYVREQLAKLLGLKENTVCMEV